MAKRKFELAIVPNVYDMGIFSATLSSRLRLRVTTGIVLLVIAALYAGLGHFLRNYSRWPMLNIGLIILLFIAIIASSYLVAVVIGDVIFPGPWREKMRLGDSYVPEKIEEQQALLKNHSLYFIFLWIACLLSLIWSYDFAMGKPLNWYQKTGTLIASMKSDDPFDRIAVLKTLSNPLRKASWEDPEIREAIVKILTDSDPDVLAQASYLAGRAQVVEGSEQLMALVKTGPNDRVRAEASLALGRIEWKPARGLFIHTMRESFEKNRQDAVLLPALFYAFSGLKDPSAATLTIQILESCLEKRDCSPEIRLYAFFYLKSLRVKQSVELALEYFDTRDLDLETRCLAADSLRFTASKNDVPALKRRFDETPSDLQCEDIYRKHHSEALVLLFEKDPLKALWVRSVGNQMDKSDYDWIYAIGDNKAENPSVRKVAEIYIRAMNEKFAL